MTMIGTTSAFAQTISEDQIVSFVKKEQAKGTKQETIITKLMQKGATPDQLRKIRKKYEAEQRQMGAVSLTGEEANQSGNRLRTSREKAEDLNRQKNGYMVRSQRELDEKGSLSRKDRREQLGNEMGFLDLDSVIYYQNLLRDESEVFGRNIFNNQNLTFEPNQNMATPANYRLGAGDNVIIDVWGASQQTFNGVISPDGTVVIEGVGPIKLAGLTVTQATNTLKSRLGQYYSGCNISLSVGETRSITVQVVGEVQVPGTYTLSSLSSAFNALYAAGGINEIGTLRNIQVYRNGRQIAVIDVYDYLINGNAAGDIRLQDNDIIRVGAYDCLVNVRGKIKRPMWYEMKSTENVKQLLTYAGGFTGDAYTKNVRLTRRSGEEYSMHTIDEFQMGAFIVKDRDSLYVDSVIARFSNMVEVRGAVKHAGKFQLGGNIQTVRELIAAAEGLSEDAYKTRAVMHRTKDDLTLEMVTVDLEGIIDGTAADIPLKKNDVLFIPSTTDMKGERTLKISGEVIYPGTYQYADNTTIEDLVLMAGGLTEAASMAKVDVFRRIKDSTATENTNKNSEVFSFSLNDGLRKGDTDFTLMPFDEVVVRKSPVYSTQQVVTIRGQVNFEGEYAMATKNYKLSDLIQAAGGLSYLAYAKGARLNRKMTEEEKVQRNNALRAGQIQMYEEAMQADKNYNMAQADSLLEMKMNMGNTYPVAVNLDKAIKNPGCTDDIVLREGDELIVPQFSNTVKVSGEVTYPISMNYEKGKSANYYIRHAGGFGNKAKKGGVYAIYMNGSVEKIKRRKAKEIEPGCEIVIPTKENRKGMTTSEIMAIATGGSSLASVVVALLSILRK